MNRRLIELFKQHGYLFYRRYLKKTRLGRLIGQQILNLGLVNATELQISLLSYDSTAIQGVPYVNAIQVEADSCVPGFHLSPPLNLGVSDALSLQPRINVLLPSLRPEDMSGGPNTALLLASLLVERGESVRLISCDIPMKGKGDVLFTHMDRLFQRPVARERIELIDATDRRRPTEIGVNDLFLATAWWTAQMAKYAVAKTIPKTFIYLIQDFEPILHDGSTFQARALETYGLSHIPVINTQLLLDHLKKERIGYYSDLDFFEKALWFEPALDRSYFFPDPDKAGQIRRKVLLFYARPTFAHRNLFELGVVALRRAVASGVIDNDNWEIWAMGENLATVSLGNGVMLKNLPWLSFDDYAKRIRKADLLLSLMLSPHPSYPPLEMAASGNLVVTNSFSVKTSERLKAISPNIIVAEPTAESIATALENAAGRINAGLPSYDPSGAIPLPSNWYQSLREIVPELLKRIYTLRKAPLELGLSLAPGHPFVPKTWYEIYRKASLARRRREGDYQQESGLLSFVTSVYNTDPVFLKELGNSVFQQDGGIHFEWLILDNGSTQDGTLRAMQELAGYPGVQLKRVEHNLGIIGGMRYCLENAYGRYILPLDSDDLIEPDCVQVLTRFIKDHNYPPLLYTDEDKLSSGRFGSPYFKPDWDPVLFLHSCYIAHLCAIDRALGLKLGLYGDKSAEGCHDWDSFIRFMNAGYVPCHVPEVLYSWRIHNDSTSGNINSKSYITESHRYTLERFLKHRGIHNIELVNSPLFNHNVDWWLRRKHLKPWSMQTIIIVPKDGSRIVATEATRRNSFLVLGEENGIKGLADLIDHVDHELIHLCWQDVIPDEDEWQWDAMALLELFPDAVMVGGIIHDGSKIVDGPKVIGFGDGFGCPDIKRSLSDPGYGAKMWKPHTVTTVSTAHCVIKKRFLNKCMAELLEEDVSIGMLGSWLGALALEAGNRVLYSPFMRARSSLRHEDAVSQHTQEHFLSRFWPLVLKQHLYSPRLGLGLTKAYVGVDPEENIRHRLHLQKRLLPYPEWLKMQIRRRADSYPRPENSAQVTIITTVYERTHIEFLDALAESVTSQTMNPAQWIIVAHGPITTENLNHIVSNGTELWGATVIVDPRPLGIIGAMRRGLESSQGEYIVPVDADDVLTPDAIQILTNAISRLNRPDLIFSDEDALEEGQPASPYLRSTFDPVLNLDSSYIWHLCAIKRERATALGLYTDLGATWCHDWDSVMRIANAGGRLEHVPEVLYHWRQHARSTTNNFHGDPRSLDSIRHILERHIACTKASQHFYVAEWPKYRGSPELYIARRSVNLPEFVWIGDAPTDWVKGNGDVILVLTAGGVSIDSQQVFLEVARIFGLHPGVGAVGGLVENSEGGVLDGCYMVNDTGMLESPWIGQPADQAGPYALALKTQGVATTGNSLAFFRVDALQQAGAWPLKTQKASWHTAIQLCGRIAKYGWTVAFSPLIRARAGSAFRSEPSLRRPPVGVRDVHHGLVRYGLTRNYRS